MTAENQILAVSANVRNRHGELRDVLLRYTQVFLAQKPLPVDVLERSKLNTIAC